MQGGRYNTLVEVGRWNAHGVWVWECIRFSLHGTLLTTLQYLIDSAPGRAFRRGLESEVGRAGAKCPDPLSQAVRVERAD